MPGPTLSQQVALLMKHLEKLSDSTPDSPQYSAITDWLRDIPPAARPNELIERIRKVFHVSEAGLDTALSPKKRRKEFDDVLPREGWLRDYVEYTRRTEPPTVFHFFVAAVTVGCALSRNVRFPRGAYDLFPNLCVILIAPSGKCRKTSACNIGVSFYREIGGDIIADKTTPEALVEAFKDSTQATGLLYAPELAVFLGKQKYQEGMVPMLTSLFDCPKEWSSRTIGRGDTKLLNVALSLLGASTMDWMQTAIPRDAFGGGFMSRLLFVVQHDTPRSFPFPEVDPSTKIGLRKTLVEIAKHYKGTFTMTTDGKEWFEDWYNNRLKDHMENAQFAGYFERKPDHLLRLSMVLAASAGNHLELTSATLEQGLRILDWVEATLPSTFDTMSTTAVGEDLMRLVKQLKAKGGVIDHSSWLRANSNRMNARTFRENVDTLRLAGMVEFDDKKKIYYLTPEGWK